MSGLRGLRVAAHFLFSPFDQASKGSHGGHIVGNQRPRFLSSLEREEERQRLLHALSPHLGSSHIPEGGPYLSTQEIALLLGVSPATIRRWTDSGKLEAIRSLGGHRMFPLSVVRRALGALHPNGA